MINDGKKFERGLFIALLAAIVTMAVASIYYNGVYTNFDTYTEGTEFVPVMYETKDKSVRTIVNEMYNSRLYPNDMPLEAISRKIESMNGVKVDNFVDPEYIIVPMPKEKVKR